MLVTATLTAPDACAGVVAVIDVLFATATAVAAVPPRFTAAPARKPVPAMVTAVPPLVVPVLGAIETTVGAGLPEPDVLSTTKFATEGTPLLFTRNNM